jgi:hypothetical protein
MRISFDTQEDTYEDALAVLRRAYGRRGPVRKPEEPNAGAEPETVVATKKASGPRRDKGATKRPAQASDAVTSPEATKARREVSGSGAQRARSTKDSAAGNARPSRRTARRAAREGAPSKAATSRVGRAEQPAPPSAAVKRSGTKGAVTRTAARTRAPSGSGSVAHRPRRLTRKKDGSGPAANVAPPGQSEAVRAWARAQGMPVSDRGRMPASVIAAYEEAHKG